MKKLAVLGASYLQLPLVKKAIKNNIEVHCFAWDDGKAICKDFVDNYYDISVLEKDIILEICKRVEVDGIVTIGTDICIPTISYVAAHMGLIGNSELCAALTTNKSLMRACFVKNKINSPAYYTVKSSDEISPDSHSYPLIVKPTDRSGSLGVVKVSNVHDYKDAVDRALEVSFNKECIVEEFIDGVEVSVETISWQGKHSIIAITDKLVTSEPYFVELSHHQPSLLPCEIKNKIQKISLAVLEATKIDYGASHIEFKITSSGDIYVIEIGSRMGGDFIGSDLVELSTGIDYVQAVIDIALGVYKKPVITNIEKYSGIYFLSKNTDYLIPYFNGEKVLPCNIIKKELQNSDLKYVSSSNDRSGYIIYQAERKIVLE